jgi:hypothetical protein
MMNQIYSKALDILMRRIKQCGTALQCSTDEYSFHYWTKELAIANLKRIKVSRRFTPTNVIHLDFTSKKRVA